jgi:IS5 family transposase
MQFNFLIDQKIYGRIDRIGDPLAKLKSIMNWSPYIAIVDGVRLDKTKLGNGGRPPIKSSVLFKGLLIGLIYHLSDEQIEFQITDRASFTRFCGLELGDTAPDANSFWLLREKLKETGKSEELFHTLPDELANVGLEYSKCAIVDATFVDAPRRRNTTKAQDEALKEHDKTGMPLPFAIDKEQVYAVESVLPEADRTMSHKLRRTDTDARRAKKGDETHLKIT